jgi:hypothetical protein
MVFKDSAMELKESLVQLNRFLGQLNRCRRSPTARSKRSGIRKETGVSTDTLGPVSTYRLRILGALMAGPSPLFWFTYGEGPLMSVSV